MIRRLVVRSLRHRPGRSLLLLAGYALGVGVTVALLSIGSALVQQSRDRTLVGGGDLTVLPAGLDLETFRTGGASSLYFSIDQAPYLYRQVLAGPRFRDRVAAAAPWIDDEVLYLEVPPDGGDGATSGRDGAVEDRDAGAADRLLPVSADGGIPSRSGRLGAAARVTEGAWRDVPADRRWTAPDDSTLYAGLDAFHLPPPTAAAAGSWAEWHYFNVLLPEDRGWLYLTYMVAGDVPDGRWDGRLLATLVSRREDGDHGARAFVADVPAEDVNFSLARPDLRIGGSSVTVEGDGRYRLRAEIPPATDGEAPTGPSGADGTGDRRATAGRAEPADGSGLRVDLTLEGNRRAYLPPLDVGRGEFPSGYVVPMLDARATGRVCVGKACRQLEATRAYHDHNWGTWAGVTWDWGHARADPYRLLYGGVRRDLASGDADGPSAEAPGATGPDAAREAPGSSDDPAAGPRFLFVTDSLGFAGLFSVDRLEHRWRAATGGGELGAGAAAAGGGATHGRRPVGLTVAAARGRDTVRLRADVRHARATRQAVTPGDASRLRLFWQMRGSARLEGRLHGRPVAARGDGFFETWTAGASRDTAEGG